MCRKLHDLPAEEVVWQFPRSVAFLGPWQKYRGYCLVVSRRHISELYQLEKEERGAFLDEMTMMARAIAEVVQPRKINYELLGNQVAHLHWHLFPRFADDPDHLKPVWVAIDGAEGDAEIQNRLRDESVDRGHLRGLLQARLRSLLAS